MKSNDKPVIVEQKINAPAEEVWKAITSIGQMTKWFFENIPDFKPEVGFKTEFPVVSGERTFTHLWTVTEVIPGSLIRYNWKYKEYPGDSYVIFELNGNSDHTNVKLTAQVTEDFPDDIPEFRRESCIGGWEYFIQGNLKEYLDKRPQ